MLSPDGIPIWMPNPSNTIPLSFEEKAKYKADQMFTYLSYLEGLEQ